MVVTAQKLTASNVEWFALMRDYFLGNVTNDELDSLLQGITPLPGDKEERDDHFEEILGSLLWDESQGFSLLQPHRRRFVFQHQFLREQAKVFRTKKQPDNCLAVAKGKNIYDVRCMEEVGFVEFGDVLITRTIQPYVLYNREGKITNQVTTPTVLVFPNQSQETFSRNFPTYHIATNDGIVFSGEFMPVEAGPQFRSELELSEAQVFVCVAYKSKFDPTNSRSKKVVDRTVYKAVFS